MQVLISEFLNLFFALLKIYPEKNGFSVYSILKIIKSKMFFIIYFIMMVDQYFLALSHALHSFGVI